MAGQITKGELLIGKEPGQGRLLVFANVNEKTFTFTLGSLGSVPNSVSRCKPADGVAHCKISFSSDGSMTIINLKPQNVTYVNGIEVESKKINSSVSVSLGKDKYPINLNEILQKILQAPSNPSFSGQGVQSVSIHHLENVWADYEAATDAISMRLQEKNKKRMLPMIISMSSGVLAPILAAFGTATLFVTVPIAAVSLGFYLKMYNEKDTSIDDKKKASDKLIEHYVCPHEGCHHFVGYTPYKILRQNKKCPYCGKPWSDR